MDDDVAAKYDGAAATYSSRYADPEFVARFYVGLVRRWGASHPPGATVLEVSCADGFMTEALVRAGYRVTALDIAPKMVAAARARLDSAGLAADLLVADVRTFEPPGRWDVILAPMWTFFAYVADADPVLERLVGALTPGGTLIVDRNPRTHPLADGIAALKRAGLTDVAWRPVSVPLTRRLGPVGRAALAGAMAFPPARGALLRRHFNVAINGTRPTQIPDKE